MKKYISLIAGILVGLIIVGGGVSIYRKNGQIDSLNHENGELRRLIEMDNKLFINLADMLEDMGSLLEDDINLFEMMSAVNRMERKADELEPKLEERSNLYNELFKEEV